MAIMLSTKLTWYFFSSPFHHRVAVWLILGYQTNAARRFPTSKVNHFFGTSGFVPLFFNHHNMIESDFTDRNKKKMLGVKFRGIPNHSQFQQPTITACVFRVMARCVIADKVQLAWLHVPCNMLDMKPRRYA